MDSKNMDELDKIILRGVPVHPTCAIEEQYNKCRREWLKKEFLKYLEVQLSNQFNARTFEDQISAGLGTGSN